jgi:hypothetical protein
MHVFDVSEFTQDAARVFDTALAVALAAANADEVIINDRDGNSYKILPTRNERDAGKSPFEDIPCITGGYNDTGNCGIIKREHGRGLKAAGRRLLPVCFFYFRLSTAVMSSKSFSCHLA